MAMICRCSSVMSFTVAPSTGEMGTMSAVAATAATAANARRICFMLSFLFIQARNYTIISPGRHIP